MSENHSPSDINQQESSGIFDVVVVGAGAAGLAAAVFASARGKRVLVVEKSSYIGGTSAFTAGTSWVPATREAMNLGAPSDETELAAKYLTGLSGKPADDPMIHSYLTHGPEAIAYLEDHSEMKFEVRTLHPDYFSDQSGATVGFRALEALTYRNTTAKILRRLRPQKEELTVFGGMMLDRTDIPRLANIARHPFSLKNISEYFLALRLLLDHLYASSVVRRPIRFTMGNALVARLAVSLEKAGVTVLTETEVRQVQQEDGKIVGVTLADSAGTIRQIGIRQALISTTGGFNRNPDRRATLLPSVPVEWSAVAESVTGEFHHQLEALGAVFEETATGAFFAPVSLAPRSGGRPAGTYPHFIMDRGKPHFIVVDQSGRRYQNEALSYNHFSQAMLRHGETALPSFLITDHTGFSQFGIGVVRPGGWGKRRRLKDGYLVRGSSLADLAKKLGIKPATLEQTITDFNAAAVQGKDTEFHRGETFYERNIGDASVQPNPNLGTIETGPYYAIRLYPGDIGTTAGFRINEHAQALDKQGKPISGLYISGNDMRSIMGDVYPAPGITLGPGIVFSYLAVKHALNG